MLRHARIVSRRRWALLGVLAVTLALVVAGLTSRLAAGPMDADWLRPAVKAALIADVDGGRATIEHVRLVWFDPARALGLQLDGVRLIDSRGRDVVRARRLEAGIAVDALPGFDLTPGRIAGHDFFVAMSVSPGGQYALGYDAKGTPSGTSTLDRAFLDLMGKARLGHPASFLRQVDLANGRLAMRQVGGTLAWTADIRTLKFEKSKRLASVHADVSLDDGRKDSRALFVAEGAAAVGLRNALLSARIDNLVPARAFPSVGSTKALAALDAVVMGRGSIAYDFRAGMRAADLTLVAGKGALRLGDGPGEAFEQALVSARYDPKSGDVVLNTFRMLSEKTRLDLNGRFHLVTEDPRRHIPARLDFTVSGPKLLASLASDAPSQDLSNVSVVGRYTPEKRRLDLLRGTGLISGVPVRANGAFAEDDRGRWGATFNAQVGGVVTPEQVFAFWPRGLVSSVRDWLKKAILGGRLNNATFAFKAPPGAFDAERVPNDIMKIGFDFREAGFRFLDELPPITDGVGHGLVQADRFDLTMSTGRIDTVALSNGVVEVPAFRDKRAASTFKGHAVGDVHALLEVIDRPPWKVLTKGGFSPGRVSGDVDATFEIHRPMQGDVKPEDMKFRYAGVVRRAGLKEAALGWDMTGGDLRVEGDQDKISVTGAGSVGPYRGGVVFNTRYQGRGDHSQFIDVNGVIDAAILGGQEGRSLPFAGKFRTDRGDGQGTVHSAMFDGRLSWKDGDGADRVVLSGWGSAPALRRAGAPFSEGLPDRFPTELRLSRAGGTWRGPLRADALSGNVAFTPGARSRLLYDAEWTPLEARRLGLGKLPMFEQARMIAIDATWAGTQGQAAVRAGPTNLALTWDSATDDHRLSANLTPADLAGLGLPAMAAPGATLPISAAWRTSPTGTAGTAEIDGTPVRFQSAIGKSGVAGYALRADLDRNTLRRWGLPAIVDLEGQAALTARWAVAEGRPIGGHVDLDFGRSVMWVGHSDWKKAMGLPARLSVDFAQGNGGDLRLTRVSAEGDGVSVEGSAVLSSGGRVVSVDFSRARVSGLIDAAVRSSRDGQVLNLNLRGRFFDARRLFDETSRPAGPGGSGGEAETVRLDATLDTLRLTDQASLNGVRAVGTWGPNEATRRMDLSASTGTGRLSAKLFPLAGATAVSADTSNAGELARMLFGITTIKGGHAVLTGRLVANGADLNIDATNVRLVKAPVMAQILTLASLRGLADTLNGEGVLFSHVVSPIQIRGKRVLIGESRATGAALGLTTKGVVDLGADTLDFQGTIAPAYTLNAAIGNVPVLGQILTSRKGEGVVGLGYWAKGSFENPHVQVNPLSLVTPGILRRMFETPPPSVETPAPKARKVTRARGAGD